ncbi:uncharacterized protein METZ01_LOCUS464463, partial [marine metagenome]
VQRLAAGEINNPVVLSPEKKRPRFDLPEPFGISQEFRKIELLCGLAHRPDGTRKAHLMRIFLEIFRTNLLGIIKVPAQPDPGHKTLRSDVGRPGKERPDDRCPEKTKEKRK